MGVTSPYEVLGVDRDADLSTIRRAYREHVKDVHPDQGGTAREFRRVDAAYRAITRDDWTSTETTSSAATETASETQVQYLEYAVVADRDWSLNDADLFEKAASANLPPDEFGVIKVDQNTPLLDSAEDCGFEWPFACRGGACANCAVAVHDGGMTNPGDNILPTDLANRGIRLSCLGEPTTPRLNVVVGLQDHPRLADLRLPTDRFDLVRSSD